MSGISKSQVSRLCEEIDEKVKAFLARPIEGDWPYLWIDATYLKVRRGGRIVSVALIIAVGVNTDGLHHFRQLLASSVYVDVLVITLKISLVTTVLAVIAGFPIAYLVSIVGKERKANLLFWVLLSFWTSFLVRAFAWVVLLGRNGVVNQLLQALGMTEQPADLLYGLGAVLIGMVHALLPLAVLTMLSVMENIDRTLQRAAATLGARPGAAFWTIYFPLALPGVAAAGIMVFVTAIGFFIVPALLGGRRETMITQLIIDQIQQTLNWGFAGAISVLLLLVVLVVFALYDRILGLSTMTGTSVPQARKKQAGRGGRALQRAGYGLLALLGTATDRILALIPKRRAGDLESTPSGLKITVWALLAAMNTAPLPRSGEHFRHGGLDALMRIGNDELDAAQASPRQLAQELRPDRLGLGRADLHAQHLASARCTGSRQSRPAPSRPGPLVRGKPRSRSNRPRLKSASARPVRRWSTRPPHPV